MLCLDYIVSQLHLSVSPWSRTPAHDQVADKIRAAIDAGELAPRDPLPSPEELAAIAGVSLAVVHTALRKLQREHYVYAIRNGGMYVTSRS